MKQSAMFGAVTARDQKQQADRLWSAPMRPGRSQVACDIGLFGDESAQLDLVEFCNRETNK